MNERARFRARTARGARPGARRRRLRAGGSLRFSQPGGGCSSQISRVFEGAAARYPFRLPDESARPPNLPALKCGDFTKTGGPPSGPRPIACVRRLAGPDPSARPAEGTVQEIFPPLPTTLGPASGPLDGPEPVSDRAPADTGWRLWRPQGDSNPCYSLERAVSWAWLDDGDGLFESADL